MAGYTPTGFQRKRLDEILNDKNEAQRTALGQDLNLDPQTADGQISGLLALSDSQLWEIAEYCAFATDPDNATDAALSNLVKINFVERLEAAPTLMVLQVTGTPGVKLPAGQLVSEQNSTAQARTLTAVEFPASGTAQVAAELTENGPIAVLAGTFLNIDTPVPGWISVTNPSAGITGRDRETDAELKRRRLLSVATNSQGMVDSMRGKVGNVAGVSSTNILVNNKDEVDANNVKGHSFEVIVEGGDNNAIAQAIWATLPFGIGWQGNTSGSAIDAQNTIQTVPFTRPVAVPVYVTATVKKRAGYPTQGAALIKTAIVSYGNGTLEEGRGFDVGDDVIYSELYTPINTVANLSIMDLRIGTTPNPTGKDDIPISVRQYSDFSVDHINVIEVE